MFANKQDVLTYAEEEDVKFVRLAFCDAFGRQKNIAIMADELGRAFDCGISFDASAIHGFGQVEHSDLLLFPDPTTLTPMPWRPSHGRVICMFCDIRHPNGTPYEADCRQILKKSVAAARQAGYLCNIGTEFEFYLFRNDENGVMTDQPQDSAGYMDIAPLDRGENVRREICLTLAEMGIHPESSHHEEGPGQNEIDFRYSDPLTAADRALTFRRVVSTVADQNGLTAVFSPKPLGGQPGNGLHINLSLNAADRPERAASAVSASFMAGLLAHIREITAVLNPTDESYRRLGERKAPHFVSWSPENRSPLIRIPAASGEYSRMELRSPDSGTNPYLAFALILEAGLDGIGHALTPPAPVNCNLFTANPEVIANLLALPASLTEARRVAGESELLRRVLPENVRTVFGI